ncbi:MAG: hypothetical protein NW701_03315 [Nitrospira sp.]
MIDFELVTRKLTLILQDLPALTDLARKSPAYLDAMRQSLPAE